jgi:RND family efflux transporter MFP subunit
MPRKGWLVPIIIIGLVASLLAVGALLLHHAESGVNKVAMSAEPKGVTVVEARDAIYRASRRYVGTLEPWLQARVGPQLASGFVDTVLVRPGAAVKRGEVLATLDCRNAGAANKAVAMQARALEERQRAAAREAARFGELLADGYVSPNEAEQKHAKAAADSAQIQALLAQASGKSLEVDDCVLRAPFAGEVSTRFADPGTFLRPGAPVVLVIDRSVIRLSYDVPEIDFAAVAPKTPVAIKLFANGALLTGEVARRSPSAERTTRTVHVEVDLLNPSREIPVGTTAEIHVDVGIPQPATEIPLLAAKIRGRGATIFVVEGGTAKKISVGVLGERGGSLFVEPDLKPGALVVTQGRSLLANNDKVAEKIEATTTKPEADRWRGSL